MEQEIRRRHRPTYTHETRVWAVAELRAGRATQKDVARLIGCTTRQVRRWMRQADIDEGVRRGLKTTERRELHLLRQANQRLQERVALYEAARDFFAQETR